MWYVLQTMTGKEEELVGMIKKVVPPVLYEECFTAYYERVWRRQQKSIVHVERLFPGYVFIIADDPKQLFLELKRVPAMSKLLSMPSDGSFEFPPLNQEEQVFLGEILGEERTAKLSYVETDGNGHVYRLSGPLKRYQERVVKYQFKKRYAIVQFPMLGIEKTAALGIILREDVQQELAYGKVEVPGTVPLFYKTEVVQDNMPFIAGDQVRLIGGSLEGMIGIVWNVRKYAAEVGIHLFGQDVGILVPFNELCLEMSE